MGCTGRIARGGGVVNSRRLDLPPTRLDRRNPSADFWRRILTPSVQCPDRGPPRGEIQDDEADFSWALADFARPAADFFWPEPTFYDAFFSRRGRGVDPRRAGVILGGGWLIFDGGRATAVGEGVSKTRATPSAIGQQQRPLAITRAGRADGLLTRALGASSAAGRQQGSAPDSRVHPPC